MKKLKPWQVVLLVIFYPVGIVYLIIWICKRSKSTAPGASFSAAKAETIRDFHSKVVGVTFKNSDGSDRQTIIKSCKVGDDIVFKPTPTKEYPDSIGVFTKGGRQLGNLNAELAAQLKKEYPTNPMSASIANITGGGEDYKYGCNIHIVIYANQ